VNPVKRSLADLAARGDDRTFSGMPRTLLVAVVAALALATGCATTTHRVRPYQMTDYAETLARDGRATIPTEEGEVTVRADEEVEVRVIDHDGVERPMTITVARLVEGCAIDVTAPNCLAGRVADEPVIARRKTHLDADSVVAAVAITAVSGLAGWCTVACDNPDKEFKEAGAITGGIFLAGAAMLALFMYGH
jgi:hypothetical protein